MDKLGLAGLAVFKDAYLSLVALLTCLGLLVFLGKCRPAAKTLWLVLLPIPILIATFFYQPLTLFIELYTPLLCVLLLVDRFLLSVDPSQLIFQRTLQEKFSLRQGHLVLVHLINRSGQALEGMFKDDIPEDFIESDNPERKTEKAFNLPPYGQASMKYALTPTRRGKFRFGQIHAQYQSKLGLLWIRTKGARPENVQVYPDLKTLRELHIKRTRAQNAGELKKRHLGLEGTQFEGLRLYSPQDDVRKMDWLATARMDKPVVRTFTHEVEQPVLILMDAGRKMSYCHKDSPLSQFDMALNTALSLARVALDRGDQVGFGVFSNRIKQHLPFAGGQGQMQRILNAVSFIETDPVEPAYEEILLEFARGLKRRSLVVIFTDLADPTASTSLINGLNGFSDNHLLLIVNIADRQLMKLAHQIPETPLAAGERAVALNFLDEREKTLRLLTKSKRAILVDTDPERLDGDLIGQYLDLKFKSRI